MSRVGPPNSIVFGQTPGECEQVGPHAGRAWPTPPNLAYVGLALADVECVLVAFRQGMGGICPSMAKLVPTSAEFCGRRVRATHVGLGWERRPKDNVEKGTCCVLFDYCVVAFRSHRREWCLNSLS